MKMMYNSSEVINTKSKFHLTTISLKVKDRTGIPKKNQWEYMMAICDPERPGHYLKRGMIRLGTRIEGEARNRAAAYLLQCEQAAKEAEAEAARKARDKRNIKAFMLNEVWKAGSPYVLDRFASGHILNKGYIAASRQRIVDYFLPWCQENNIVLLSDLGKAALRSWRNWFFAECKAKGKAPSLVNNTRISIAVALNWAEACELIDINPMASVDKVKEDPIERQPYTPGEVVKMFKAEWPDYRAKVAFMLAITTGARLGELQGLRWVNVDIIDVNDAHLDIVEQFQETLKQGFVLPKSKKPRLNVYIRKDVAEAMEKLKSLAPFHICVFNNPKRPGVPMDRDYFEKGLKAGAEAAGVTLGDRLWHSARHTWLTNMAHNAGIEEASRSIGHSSSRVTKRYVHETQESKEQERKIIDGMFRKIS